MPPSSRWIAVGAAVSIALVVYGLFALYDMAREDALTRVASLTTEQADATAPPPDPAEGDLTLEEEQAATPGDSPTDSEISSSAASDEQAESTAEVRTTAADEDPADSSAGPPVSEDSAGQPRQVETQIPAEQAGEAASLPEEAAVSSTTEDEAAAPPGVVEPEPADPGAETAVGSGGEADPPDLQIAQQDKAPSSPTTAVADSAEETPPATESGTGDTAEVAEVVAPAPEPAAAPQPAEQEVAEPALAEAEATLDEPAAEPPPSESAATGDVPEVAEVVAPVPEPAAAPQPAEQEVVEPALAEAEATLDEPAAEPPPPESAATGDVPEVAEVVAPVPEPAAAPQPAEQEDAESALVEAEATPAQPAEEAPSATTGSETGDVPEAAEIVAPAPEPAEPPAPVVREDPEPALAEAERTPDEPAEETPSAPAGSETGDVPEAAEIVAPAPEPAEPPAPVVREDPEPALAEAERTPDEPAEEMPPVTAGSETGDAPAVDPPVAPAPEPAAVPEPIEPQDAEPELADAETTPAEHVEDLAPAPSTDGSERAAGQTEPATAPVPEAQTADVAAAEQTPFPEAPDTGPAVRADGSGPDDGAPSEAAAAQQVAALPEAPDEATAPDRAGAATPEEPTPGPESTAPPPPEDVAQFDVVQVSPDGTVVVAGRTAPGSQVELVVDGEVIATADTNRNGEFVFVPDVQLLPGVRELSIAVQSPDVPDRRTASRTVVVLIPDREMLAARVAEPTESLPSEAPIALLVDEQGETVGVIQPSPSMAEPDTVLSLTTVTFDEDGYASITGGGEAGQKVTVYLDNEATGSTIIGENGYWTVRTQHPLAKTGSYKVRIDQTAPDDGTVTERIVTTLIRAGGKLIPAAATVVTVVKGNTLWGISRRHYGRGILYTLIYDSNSYQIADPHWIYPGQKFLIPERN
ncbi:MAG: LysM peptidoglycan-binding domain-containing protein [Rhodospirillales bacterium]|nr:LysM peptidoglycan-binding domain-containing protein [Rhodospirillales bacterium]